MAWSLIQGAIFKAYCRLFQRNVKVGKRVRVSVWPKLKGPGRVHIGDKVCFVDNYAHPAQLITYRPEATISIGSGSILGGTKIFCADQVQVGSRTLLGLATILDSHVIPCDEVSALPKFRDPSIEPVILGDHVWLGTHAIVTKGVKLDEGSVVGAGAVVFAGHTKNQGIFIGNPARVLGERF